MEAHSDGSTDAVRRRIAGLSAEKQQALEWLLQRKQIAGSGLAIPRRARSSGTAPLSATQRSLWIIDQLDPGSVAYIVAAARRLRGPLDVPRLERAFQDLVRRHDSLRTTFAMSDGEPVQVVNGSGTWLLPVVDLRRFPRTDHAATEDRLLRQEAQRPFDLQDGPLFRAALYRREENVHDLLIVAHHIIFDGWSMGILLRELGTLYAAFVQGQPAPLPALAIQYADYAAWQRDTMQGEVLDRQRTYWRDRLSGAPQTIELPTERPRSSTTRWPGRNVYFALPASLTEELRRLSRQEGATLYVTLLAAFLVLLSRHSGQSDLVIGTTVSTRSRSELEGVIGCFVNTLGLRTDVSGNPTFRELLARVREAARGAFAHQDFPFDALVEELRPERDPGRNPLFQVLFALQNSPGMEFSLPAMGIEQLDVEIDTAKFDLSFELTEMPQGLRARLEYRSDLFEGDMIARLWAQYQTLLMGIVADPDRRLSELPLLPLTEQQRMIGEWNQTATMWPIERSLEELVAEQAARTPQAVALVGETETLTYVELLERADALAQVLRDLGVGPETVVGVWLERTPALVVGILGILRAGGAYLPLDPTYPAERLAFVLADAQVPVLVTQRALLGDLPANRAQVVVLEEVTPAANGVGTPPPVEPTHPAYVIYTSGSTGRPKGVVVPRQGVTNFLLAMHALLAPTVADALLAVTSVAFDIALLELFLPLLVGGRVVLASRVAALDGDRLGALLEEHGITLLQGTPATWRLLLTAGWRGRQDLVALCGGEALPADLAQALAKRCRALWNLYGPTETTVWSTAQQVTGTLETAVSIGRPISNTRCYVLDRYRQLVPMGVPGELYIGGAGVARGYRKRPEMTAERFVPDPFGAEPGGRLYRTGDLVRWHADGTLGFLGRLDQQVKLRGYRIEPGEVEAALRRQPGVTEAAVVLRQDHAGDPCLVAYVVARQGAVPTTDGLRRAMGASLPEYMLPSAIITLDSLPLTPNGKLDRKALPAPDGLRPKLGMDFVAPGTALEQIIAEAWRAVLHLDRVGTEDNFFDLGGKSFLLIQVRARLLQTLQRDVSLVELFQYPTITALARHLSAPDQGRRAVTQGQLRARRYRELVDLRQPVLRDGGVERE